MPTRTSGKFVRHLKIPLVICAYIAITDSFACLVPDILRRGNFTSAGLVHDLLPVGPVLNAHCAYGSTPDRFAERRSPNCWIDELWKNFKLLK